MNKPNEFDAFTELVDKVLAVPHSVIQERVEEHRKRAQENPQKRGPKQKATPSASARASSPRKKKVG
jgi:hypothetical protein